MCEHMILPNVPDFEYRLGRFFAQLGEITTQTIHSINKYK